ncbi:MAG: DUF4129 domain-containing protein [Anaerolineae bacterium]|nr:DUF4129 domain-containing protein [Anaerolineae bacterium]MCB0241980.1 DUF4129 domain-containing protein [Anaerolineae bacterium]MCB0250594.1 DUF4129 domain-containing protein [Anaerolineae bacterium]MCB9133018.1 DUF4129 domain-containing protein [Anaerolineales bacterium]MCO5245127.1 DUF4129 domain-containing protein [Anaerolineae bacterium]
MSGETGRPPAKVEELRDSSWQSDLGRPLLIAIQMTCLIAGPLAVVIAVADDPRLRYVAVLAFFAALAAVYSRQWLSMPSQRTTRKTAYKLAELMVLILVLRLVTWALTGDWPTTDSLRTWLLDPLSFLDGFYLVVVLLTALAWQRAGIVAELFYQLALTPGELQWVEEQSLRSWWRGSRSLDRAQISRAELVDGYINQWLIGGIFIILCAGATRISIDQQAGLRLLDTGVPDQLVVAAVMYFLTGLVLISQARLAQMRAQWYFDGVEVPPGLPARWNRLGLVIIIGIGLAASLLPLGSTWQLGAIINVIVTVVVQIAVGIVSLLIALFSLVLLLFGKPPAELPQLPTTLQPAPPPPPPVPTAEVPPWLGGAGFWLVVIVILVLALRFFIGPDGLAVTRNRLRTLGRRLLALFGRWWAGARAAAASLAIVVPRRRAADEGQNAALRLPWRFVRLNALSPRERVRYFYLSTIRRAAEQGTVRQPSQTPVEFLRDLESTWPDAENDAAALTEAFLAARYDRVEISPDDAQETKTVWERVKRALKQRRAASDAEDTANPD